MLDIKKYVREHERIMNFLSYIYRKICFNSVKGRSQLSLTWKGVFPKGFRILNYGAQNQLSIGKGCRISNSRIRFFGNNNTVYIANDCVLNDVDMWVSDGGTVAIGHNTHFVGKIHLACTEGKKISIGDKCLFSNEIVFRTGDSHSILDQTGARINQAKDIQIGNHVWIGQQVIILKGACIGDDSIIGTRALVTGKTFEKGVILTGTPAKVAKTHVNWDHRII